ATGPNGCESSERLEVTVTIIHAPAGIPDVHATGVQAVAQPILADLQVNESNVIWFDAPIDGNPYDPTDPLVNGNTYYAAATGPRSEERRVGQEVRSTRTARPKQTKDNGKKEHSAGQQPRERDLQ